MSKEPIYLSVVLSTYNDEKYIAEAIQSILEQTYPYFEFIIVNDGSYDRTLEIINSFKNSRIILIDKPNTGLIDSLNIGILSSKYDWIARVDFYDIYGHEYFGELTFCHWGGMAPFDPEEWNLKFGQWIKLPNKK